MASSRPYSLVKNNTSLKISLSLSLTCAVHTVLSQQHFSGNYQGGRPPAAPSMDGLSHHEFTPPAITLPRTSAYSSSPLWWPSDSKLAHQKDRETEKKILKQAHCLAQRKAEMPVHRHERAWKQIHTPSFTFTICRLPASKE